MNDIDWTTFDSLAKRRNEDTTVYEDSSTFDVAKDYVSKSGLGKLLGYGTMEDRNKDGYGNGFFDAPRTLNKDGKRYGTKNKIFNDMDEVEANTYIQERMIKSDNPDARHFYKLVNPNTGDVKYGLAGKGGVSERYKKDKGIQDWIVEYDEPTDNAEELENTIHGSKAFRDRRKYDYGKSTNANLLAGGTEIYTSKPMNDAKVATDTVLTRTNTSSKLQEMQDGITARTAKNIETSANNKRKERSLLDAETWKLAGEQLVSEATDSMPTGDGLRDFGLGMSINVDKVFGGITGLMGDSFKQEQDFWEERANINYEAIKNKDGVSQTLGEIAPDLLINPSVKGKLAYDMIMQGVSAMAPEALKMFSKSNKIGLEATPETVAMAGGIGGALGGIMSKLMKTGNVESIVDTKEFKEATQKEQELVYSLMKEVKDIQTAKQTDFTNNPPKTDIELVERTVKNKKKEETVELSTKKEQRRDKKGNLIQDGEGLDILSSTEMTVHSPLSKADYEKVKRTYTKEWNEDFRGRKYAEESSLLSSQGGDIQKATLKLEEQAVENAEEEVDRRLKIYDDSMEVRKTYGQNQARIKGENTTSGAQAKADRISFEREQYKSIAFDKNLPKEIKKVAHQKLAELKNKKVTEQVSSKGNIAKAKAKVEEANKPVSNKREDTKRSKDLSKQYKIFSKADEKRGEGYRFKDTQVDEKQIASNIIKNGLSEKEAVSKANANIKKAERAGTKPKPEDTIIVQTALDRRADLKAYKNGQIDIHELRYREKLRLDKEQDKVSFKDDMELKESEQEKVKKYEELGITKKERVFKEDKEKKGISSKKQQTGYNLEKDKSRSTKKSMAENYEVGSGKSYRNKTTGQNVLKDYEMDLLDKGITPETIGKLNSAEESIRQQGIKEANTVIRENNGIEIMQKPDNSKRIWFKDETIDASSQAYQIFTMLTGDKKLAKITKTLEDASADLRVEIASEMNTMKLPSEIVNKLGGSIKKSHVKPLVMLKSYGQGTKSAVREFAETNNISIKESEIVVEAFTKALGTRAQTVIKAMDAIYALQKGAKGKFSWKLPNGRVVKYTENAQIKGELGKGNEVKVERQDESDMGARGLMPNIVHSIDGYIVGEIAKRIKKPIQTIHDAMTVKTGNSSEVQKIYNELLGEILEKDLLHSIMKDLGYKGKSLQLNTLKKSDVVNAKNSMELEHIEGTKNPEGKDNLIGKRVNDDSRVKKPNELMKDYMASLDHRSSDSNQILDDIVNEQMYSSLELDLKSPFERAIHFAMKGPRFTDKMIGEIPSGVNKKLWKDTQMELFEEARKKLEFNPLLSKDNAVKGTRFYTNSDGSPVKGYTPSVTQLTRLENKIGNKKLESKEYVFVKKEIAQTFKEVKDIVHSWKPAKIKRLNETEKSAKSLVEETRIEAVENKSRWTKFKDWFTAKPMSEDFRKKYVKARKTEADTAKLVEDIQNDVKSWSKELQEDAQKHIVQTDYQSIFNRGIKSEQDAQKVWESKEAQEILRVHGKQIEQTARGVGVKSEQFGYFKNNAEQLVKEGGLPKEATELVDTLITIQAIKQNNSWKAIEKMSKDKNFNDLMDMVTEIDRQNKELFTATKTSTSGIKGYQGEVFNKGKKIDEETGEAKWDADGKDELGIVPSEREKARIGSELNKDLKKGEKAKPIGVTSMQKNRIKQTGDRYFKVVDEETRIKAGKTDNLAETLARTFETNSIKKANRENIQETVKELSSGLSTLYSMEKKSGMVPLTKKEIDKLPQELKNKLKFINKDLKQKILGRKEQRIYSGDKQLLKIADRLVKNLGTMFKQNVVLKNLPSYINATVVNQTTAMVHGVNPKDLAVWQAEAVTAMNELKKYETAVNIAKSKGRKIPKDNLSEKAKILQSLEKEGLSTNKLEGTVESSKPLINNMVGKFTNKHVGTVTNNILLNQGSKSGNAINKVFTAIDTTGRYVIARQELKNGSTIAEAVDKANGLFADMNMMVHPIIEKLDSYLGLPFIKWASLSAPMAMKVAKDNPVKAIIVMLGVYFITKESGKDFQSQSPTTQFIDMLEQYVTKIPDMINGDMDIERFIESVFIPSYITKALETQDSTWEDSGKLKKGKTIGELIKTNTKKKPKNEDNPDRRGATQQLFDYIASDN